MCGIVACTGDRDSKKVLLEGLKNMEYRGYDSAGVVLVDRAGRFQKIRTVRKNKPTGGGLKKRALSSQWQQQSPLCGLKMMLARLKPGVFVSGMGHTRWATHGPPSLKNTHPHQAGHIYLVHNGIVENAEELKHSLKGGSFVSDTDTEVAARLFAVAYGQSSCLVRAAARVLYDIKGSSALVAMSKLHPHELVAFKKGPSLIVGFGKKALFVASDVEAFAPEVQKGVFLEDGELAYMKRDGQVVFYSLVRQTRKGASVKKIKKTPVKIVRRPGAKTRPVKSSYMLEEMEGQPAGLARLVKAHLPSPGAAVKLNWEGSRGALNPIVQAGRLKIAACGSSYHGALYGKYVIEHLARVPVEVDRASEFRYRSPILNKEPVLLISQSGETADTLAVLKMVKEAGGLVGGLCNVRGSFLDRYCDFRLYMRAGPEKAVASTKAFLSTVLTLLFLALALAKKKKLLSRGRELRWVEASRALPSRVKKVLSDHKVFASSARYLESFKGLIYLARGVFYPLALEGALKMKELTYQPVEAYPAGEMKHGPLALMDRHKVVVAVVPDGPLGDKTLINLTEARARGAKLLIMAEGKNQKARALADRLIPLSFASSTKGEGQGFLDECMFSLLCIPPLQLLAYYRALALGHNVDQPRGLAKSVTVE